jgi:hypothetical protein
LKQQKQTASSVINTVFPHNAVQHRNVANEYIYIYKEENRARAHKQLSRRAPIVNDVWTFVYVNNIAYFFLLGSYLFAVHFLPRKTKLNQRHAVNYRLQLKTLNNEAMTTLLFVKSVAVTQLLIARHNIVLTG